jgi:hypothetical protein
LPAETLFFHLPTLGFDRNRRTDRDSRVERKNRTPVERPLEIGSFEPHAPPSSNLYR